MNLALNLKHTLFILITLLLALLTSPSQAYFGGEIKEQDISFDQNVASQIENSFLYSKKEVMAVNHSKDLVEDAKYLDKSTKVTANKFGLSVSKPKYDVNLNKKTKEKIAYNSYINGQYEIAVKIYKQLVEEYPFDDYPQYCLALTYQKLKQNKKAKDIYFSLLKRKISNKKDVVANLVTILSEESPKEAIYLLAKLARQNPDSGYFLAQKALIFENMGNFDMAIASMIEATNKEPERIDYKFNLAVIYDRNDKFEEALRSYHEVLQGYKNDNSWEKNIPIDQVISRIDIVKTFI